MKITKLINPTYLPNQTISELATKKKILQQVLEKYCGTLDGCGLPDPDRIPVRMDLMVASLRGSEQMSCRHGFSLLSCGMDNIGGKITSF